MPHWVLIALALAATGAVDESAPGIQRVHPARADCEWLQARVDALSESDEGNQAMVVRYNTRLCWADLDVEELIAKIRQGFPDGQLGGMFDAEQAAWRSYRDARCGIATYEQGAWGWPTVWMRACQLAETSTHRATLQTLNECMANTAATEDGMLVAECEFGARDAESDPNKE